MVNGKKPWHNVSARFIAAVSAAAMIATLTISGTAFALGNDATDSGTSDADQSSTSISQNTAKQAGESTEPQSDTQQESSKTADTPATTAARAANVGTVVGATPSNTTMDLFDYWLTGQNNRDDNDDIAATLTQGINSNGHELKFLRKSYGTEGGKLAENGSLNAWTGSSAYNRGGPFSGMVDKTLSNGYPMLNAGQYYQGQGTSEDNNRSKTDTNVTTQQQSLSYLFNPQECLPDNGCAAYQNVTGLLQQGTNGIYSYDSQQNFASIDTTTNKFTLYNAPAVNAGTAVADQSDGQFFPFNTADQVFNSNNGTQSTLTSTDQVLNHYFGLHMSTTFTQPSGGQVNGQDMVFNFTGDDDVWVFIDGKLVGDVGGLHDRLSLSINFRTGNVTVADGSSNAGSNPRTYSSTTLKDTLGLTNATFTSGSEHTLDFFYLERGNGNSNLKLETNLVYHPANELLKVDQVGNPIPDVTFELYEANENGVKTNETSSATGTTDANGKFTFKNKDNTNKLLTLSELYADGVHPDYVLIEKAAPTGYRKAGDMHLRLQKDKQGNVYATSVNKFETGAIAVPRVQTTITATKITGERQSETEKKTITDDMLSSGRIVAVAMRFNSSTCSEGSTGVNCWQAVVGNAENGWSEQGTGFAGVLKAAQQNYVQHGVDYNAFVKNENGQWSADVHDLPGEVGEYYYAVTDPTKADVNYSIGYFYIPNSAIQNADSTDTSGMYRLDSEGYDRQYASVIEVPNIRNILVVQKTDADGNPIANNGTTDNPATFELYEDDSTGKPKDEVYSTQQTTDQKVADGRLGLTDAVSFPSSADTAVLETGKTYWVHEKTAPSGYVLNDHWVKVVVTDKGVHADATAYTAVKDADGNITSMTQVNPGAKDNVSVNEGLGTLVRTMTQWAGDGGDDPLQYITGTLQTGSTAQDGSITWNTPTDADPRIKFQYGYGKTADTPLLKYGYFSVDENGNAKDPQTLDNTTFSVEDGYADVTMRPTNLTALLTDATPLLTGSTIIRVGDETTSVKVQLSFYKQVEGADWPGKTADNKDQNFSFTLTRTDNEGKVTYPTTENGTTTTTELVTNGTVSASTSGKIEQGGTNRQLVGVKDNQPSANPLPELTFTKNGTYTFTLKEDTANPVSGWKYDDTTHTITIEVTGCETRCVATVKEGNTVISAPDGNTSDTQSGEIVFTNRFIAVSSLPLTGGDASARDWLIGGSIFAIAAALALAATYEYRKRKNLTF
ncbi:hypothetical protein BHAP_0559 [Bifidobacterium hapali]|uniref:PA14 domain-containing protein n=1 Tax=Bifidobacterium hapali TaxID=1630172 RepID=A0A261G2F0_9BIFI|nr:FctA domain-containing protein [Bifidobacterium hapali]OZG65611.1 hypothetical protein BHAP_0559 [Bifidobacterium hapali]